MDIDSLYPALSSLARANKRTLNDLGKMASSQEDVYLRLGDCCNLVLRSAPRWAVDYYNYLATVNEFVARIDAESPAHQKVWQKIFAGPKSGFLDTVVEAVWALHFWDKGLSPILEAPFDSSSTDKGKDADLLLTVNGRKFWLDVISANWKMTSGFWKGTDGDIAPLLAKKAKEKYDAKFKRAITQGLLKDAVGVLLCVLMKEKDVIPSFVVNLRNDTKTPVPTRLFDDMTPNLELVWVHTIRPRQNSDILQPSSIVMWTRNAMPELKELTSLSEELPNVHMIKP